MKSSRYEAPVTPYLRIFVNALLLFLTTAEDNIDSNCEIINFSTIRCFGEFNVSNFLFEQRQLSDQDTDFWSRKHFKDLELWDTTIEIIDDKVIEFHGFEFETILIENAPNLKSIHPQAFVDLKDNLTDFRAINTSLPPYNDYGNDPHKGINPFHGFTKLLEVYIGEQSHCPPDESLLFPCECEFGVLPRTVPNGLHGWSWGTSTAFGRTTHITCDSENMTGDRLKDIFLNISRSDHTPKHFDVLTLSGTNNLTDIPSDVFHNVTITTIWMEKMHDLKSIHPNAFRNTNNDRVARSIQVLSFGDANFTAAHANEVGGIFQALSSLTNIRLLRLNKCGIPYIPAYAFVPENSQKQLNNLLYVSLSFDRRRHSSGLKSVGTYAFSGAPNLIELGLSRNFIEIFDSFAFAFNKTSNRTLVVHIGGNPFNDSVGLKPDAFSGSQRPLQIKFSVDSFAASDLANDPSFHFMPENVFKPFIEENPNNFLEIDYFNVDIWCDCQSQWMFEADGYLKKSVQNGLRIKRVEDNFIRSEPYSIQCKAESSFECLPNCLSFPLGELLHCAGNKHFDVKKTFDDLHMLNGSENISKLIFSSKEIQELPRDAFGSFRFKEIRFTGCWNLSSIHSNQFGTSAETVEVLIMENTNLTHYPNFAKFPSLKTIQLDESHPYYINSSTFDFTDMSFSRNAKFIDVFLNNGIIDQTTFNKLNNETGITLNVGENKDCSTIACLLSCKASKLKLDKKILEPFLAANPQNQIKFKCYLECSCELQWIQKDWLNIKSQIDIWVSEYFGYEFYCAPPGVNVETTENFFGVDPTKFDYGNFLENCK